MIEVRTPDAPVETVTPIKPSEALRLGRLIRPEHVTASMFDGERGACALGAMIIGWDIRPNQLDARLASFGVSWCDIAYPFDEAEAAGTDGDAVVLASLEGRGL
jgi:hypothetical protein